MKFGARWMCERVHGSSTAAVLAEPLDQTLLALVGQFAAERTILGEHEGWKRLLVGPIGGVVATVKGGKQGRHCQPWGGASTASAATSAAATAAAETATAATGAWRAGGVRRIAARWLCVVGREGCEERQRPLGRSLLFCKCFFLI